MRFIEQLVRLIIQFVENLMRLLGLALLFALAACANGEPLPPIQGPWVALDPTQWQPTPAEQQAIRDLPER